MDDERNFSDALAEAILKMDYPDLHRGDGVYRAPPPKVRKRVHQRIPKPDGLALPRGLVWLEQHGRIGARVCVDGSIIHVGYCDYDADAIAALAARREYVKQLALSGALEDEIRAALGRKEAA